MPESLSPALFLLQGSMRRGFIFWQRRRKIITPSRSPLTQNSALPERLIIHALAILCRTLTRAKGTPYPKRGRPCAKTSSSSFCWA